ncbi:MAG: hypothetical protein BWX66_00257 [Deltaproteobacteria bacterium ADurb.Bin058]|nr:MAG: hypothetical protein BWX66_00257 [Deltaproteobacteria bacterium ADurb.Bin058]
MVEGDPVPTWQLNVNQWFRRTKSDATDLDNIRLDVVFLQPFLYCFQSLVGASSQSAGSCSNIYDWIFDIRAL